MRPPERIFQVINVMKSMFVNKRMSVFSKGEFSEIMSEKGAIKHTYMMAMVRNYVGEGRREFKWGKCRPHLVIMNEEILYDLNHTL